MKGLGMPVFPEETFLRACLEVTARNAALGFRPFYDPKWERDGFVNANAVYLRPFSFSEGGIGVGIPERPSVFIVANPVGSYFKPGYLLRGHLRAHQGNAQRNRLDQVRRELRHLGPREAGGREGRIYGSPLPGRARAQVCRGGLLLQRLLLPQVGRARHAGARRYHPARYHPQERYRARAGEGIEVSERRIAIEEVLADAKEVFFTGTAAGVTFVESVTHLGRKASFGDKPGELTAALGRELKGIQYGIVDDTRGWMKKHRKTGR